MFEPRTIWLMLGAIVAAYAVYATVQPARDAEGEPYAYLRTTTSSGTKTAKLDRDECISATQRIWAVAGGQVVCIAYLMPPEQPPGSTALVFFHGDIPKSRQTADKMDRTRLSYVRRATNIAEQYSIPVYVVARPGVLGSSGLHVIGGVHREHAFIAAAIDELKRRHGIDRIVLGGQSGGARLSAQLVASGRTDIDCAVMASGNYGIPRKKGGGRMSTNIWGTPSRSYFIPLRNVQSVADDTSRRLFVVGDTRDQRTPFDGQREWANALQQAGHNVVLLTAPGGGKENHYLTKEAMQIAAMCATGQDDAHIRRYVGGLPAR